MFPTVDGRNLNGVAFRLPRDFKAPASIVFVAFKREQQRDVDSWKTFVRDVRAKRPDIGEYEVPVLSKGDALIRFLIDGGMRRGIPDLAVRAATITLYIDKGPFDASLGLASESDIAVLLVEPDGTILWRAAGAYVEGKGDGLDAVLATLGRS